MFEEGGTLLSILTYFPSDYQYVRRRAPPPTPKKQLCFLGGGRCTRFFRLIINVLYAKRGKSAPPSIKTLAKKCTCNPDIVKSAFAFFELNAKHAHGS